MEIKFDKRNYRKHNDRNKELIKKSLDECGAGRSIVIDNDGEIIAGNGIYEQVQKLKMPVKVIETDGSELVVVKRTDLSTDDEKRKQLAIMDNSTSDSSEFDLDLLKNDFTIEELQDYGLDLKDDEEDTTYTSEIKIPQYEPQGENITIEEMCNSDKTDSLITEIESSNLPRLEKDFLIKGAYRHLKFNYREIAEYYAKASPEFQRLAEKSALVIIDYDDALANGYTNLDMKLQRVLDDD